MREKSGGDSGNSAHIHIESVPRDVYFIAVNKKPEIPNGYGRPCPQCGQTAWLHTRWCWHCKYDFDRASVAKCHPANLLAISLAFNVVLLVAAAFLVYTSHMN